MLPIISQLSLPREGTGFPIKDAQLLKYEKLIYYIIKSSSSSLGRSGICFFWETLFFAIIKMD